jgi:hypothetical protein
MRLIKLASGRYGFNVPLWGRYAIQGIFGLWRPLVRHNRADHWVGFAFPGLALAFYYA